jgi:hypothetical protein
MIPPDTHLTAVRRPRVGEGRSLLGGYLVNRSERHETPSASRCLFLVTPEESLKNRDSFRRSADFDASLIPHS